MKILHIAETLDPAAGGPPSAFNRLAAAQGALGHEVAIASVAAAAERQEAIRRSVAGIPGYARVRRVDLTGRYGVGELVFNRMEEALRQEIARADYVLLQGIWAPLMVLSARLCRKLGKRYAMATHGMLTPTALARKRLKKMVSYRLFGFRGMLDHADLLLPNNSVEADGIRRLGLRPRVEILPNGVFLEEFTPVPSRGGFRERLGIGNKPLVLFLARLHPIKGLDLLAAAFAIVAARIPDAQLACVGPDDGMKAPLEGWMTASGLRDRLHLPGPLYGSEKFGAIVDADVFVLSSKSEGSSMSIAEAMGVGKAVVITQGCNFAEVGRSGAGIVVPHEAEAMAGAICAYLKDPEAATQAGLRGRQLITTEFTWSAIAERLTRLTDASGGRG